MLPDGLGCASGPGDLGDVLSDPVGWLDQAFFGNECGAGQVLGSLLLGHVPLDIPLLGRLWLVFYVVAVFVYAPGVLWRTYRDIWVDHRAPQAAFVQAVVRVGLVAGLAAVSAQLLRWASRASDGLGDAAVTSLLRAAYPGSNAPSGALLLGHVQGLMQRSHSLVGQPDLLQLVVDAMLAIAMLYLVLLLAGRALLLIFTFVVAPAAIAFAPLGAQNKVFGWWSQLTLGALAASVVVKLGVTLTVVVADGLSQDGGGLFGRLDFLDHGQALVAAILLFAGLWVTSQAVGSLTLGVFRHGHPHLIGMGVAFGAMGLATEGFLKVPGLGRHGAGTAPGAGASEAPETSGDRPTGGDRGPTRPRGLAPWSGAGGAGPAAAETPTGFLDHVREWSRRSPDLAGAGPGGAGHPMGPAPPDLELAGHLDRHPALRHLLWLDYLSRPAGAGAA